MGLFGKLEQMANKTGSGSRPPNTQYGSGYSQHGGGYGGQQHQPYPGGGHTNYPSSPQPEKLADGEKGGDNRPLPEGWVKQWDSNYNRHFFVDTRATPPRSIWVHPNDEAPQSSHNFSPPTGPPPTDQRMQYGQQQGMPYQGGYGQPPMMGGGYGQQPMYAQQQMGPQRGRFGGGGGGGMGMGGMALGAGAGLLGGAMLMNAFDDHNDYQQGYEDGADGGGGDFDGGGGDF